MKNDNFIRIIFIMFFLFTDFVFLYAEPVKSGNKGPIGCWKFDEGEGTKIIDSSGNGNDGEIKGLNEGYVKWTTSGKFRTALDFDYLSKEKVGCVVIPNLCEKYDLSKGFTVSVWIKPRDIDFSKRAGFFYKEIISDVMHDQSERYGWYGRGFRLRILPARSAGRIEIMAGDGKKRGWRAYTPYFIKDNVWVYVAGIYDGSEYKIYINGRLSGASQPRTIFYKGTKDLFIGSCPDLTDGFIGIIDEVKMYDYERKSGSILKEAISEE